MYFSGYLDYLWYLAGPYRNHVLLALAGVGLLFALRTGTWPAGRRLGANAGAFALPWGLRLGPFRPDHLVIVLFLPAALLLGDLLVSAGEAAGAVLPWSEGRWDWALSAAALFSLCLWGVLETAQHSQPVDDPGRPG